MRVWQKIIACKCDKLETRYFNRNKWNVLKWMVNIRYLLDLLMESSLLESIEGVGIMSGDGEGRRVRGRRRRPASSGTHGHSLPGNHLCNNKNKQTKFIHHIKQGMGRRAKRNKSPLVASIQSMKTFLFIPPFSLHHYYIKFLRNLGRFYVEHFK